MKRITALFLLITLITACNPTPGKTNELKDKSYPDENMNAIDDTIPKVN